MNRRILFLWMTFATVLVHGACGMLWSRLGAPPWIDAAADLALCAGAMLIGMADGARLRSTLAVVCGGAAVGTVLVMVLGGIRAPRLHVGPSTVLWGLAWGLAMAGTGGATGGLLVLARRGLSAADPPERSVRPRTVLVRAFVPLLVVEGMAVSSHVAPTQVPTFRLLVVACCVAAGWIGARQGKPARMLAPAWLAVLGATLLVMLVYVLTGEAAVDAFGPASVWSLLLFAFVAPPVLVAAGAGAAWVATRRAGREALG